MLSWSRRSMWIDSYSRPPYSSPAPACALLTPPSYRLAGGSDLASLFPRGRHLAGRRGSPPATDPEEERRHHQQEARERPRDDPHGVL
ncbi:hypothetical protein GUJ93_ZPchr0013g33899 [Zizania palustris]|uniref:Uncharacterized protein n=1 Tax=Zizania palustris TaxID=103762 RepID=A0A8J5X142_ZIZPA|nr:hypothetical protein GUJ93_ZPchr0013g33899 [Zizania palustris]